jgi:DNA helicase-2/ATP-dependent DNA helicase PcrA
MAVIDPHPHRVPKRLFTDRNQGQKVILHQTFDDRVEASFIIDTIANQVARSQAEPGDFAIMYRTNAQSRVVEEAFLNAGLPYKLVGAQRFYGRREIKDMIAFLRLVHNPDDEISLSRVINVPPRGIGDKTYEFLQRQARKAGISQGLLLLELGKDPQSTWRETFIGRTGSSLVNFAEMLASWYHQKDASPPLALMDRIIEDTGYQDYIDDGSEEGHDRWENVAELRRLAAEYLDQGLEAFLEQVALVSDQDTIEESSNVPTLLTLHAAKGLEFPTVFIIGLNDGVLPHSRSFDDPEQMMEERRLFYVGITRAENTLYLLFNENRNSYGYAEPVIPSRFLEDIPQDILQITSATRQRAKARGDSYGFERWESSTAKATARAPKANQYHPGMRVEHPTWGEGMVLNSRLQDDDEIVDIFFEELGLKRVAASLARLEIKS